MDGDLARSLLAGWIAGALAGIVATGVLLVLMARRPTLAARVARTPRLGVVGVVLANGLTLTLTVIGLILGGFVVTEGGVLLLGMARDLWTRVAEGRSQALTGFMVLLVVALLAWSVVGAPVIRAYGVAGRTARRLDGAIDAHRRAQQRAIRLSIMGSSIGEIAAGLALAGVVVVGVTLGADRTLSVGQITAFLFLVTLFIQPVQEVIEDRRVRGSVRRHPNQFSGRPFETPIEVHAFSGGRRVAEVELCVRAVMPQVHPRRRVRTGRFAGDFYGTDQLFDLRSGYHAGPQQRRTFDQRQHR